jgi:hypothetical protein
LSIDKDARSTSVKVLYQNARCPVIKSAFLGVGGQCFPLRKGLIVVLDSASTPHGVWANPITDLAKHPWVSVELVSIRYCSWNLWLWLETCAILACVVVVGDLWFVAVGGDLRLLEFCFVAF